MELTDAHAALADAEATAALLAAYMRASGERRMWDEWLAFGETIEWPAPPRLGTAPVWRSCPVVRESLRAVSVDSHLRRQNSQTTPSPSASRYQSYSGSTPLT
ncbi:hypothetical protein BKA03_002750 [Demequina lutea]|uniref:Uncharacterized protein n=1 Tax=Demequina lutea TaxID=431489 RepID=A0A7Z0CIJ0_9MICO|nr:hypothetical protein [Demequina lutea]